MVTWALENAIETADSMKSRGYGLPGRTAFSIYRFDNRDKAALAWISGTGAYILSAALHGDFYWRYFPSMKGTTVSVWSITAFLAYLMLCATPLIIDKLEDKKWKHIESSI
jgi:energy-coupling factor transport system permease protein